MGRSVREASAAAHAGASPVRSHPLVTLAAVTPCPTCRTPNEDGARFCVACGSSLIAGCPVCGAEVPGGAHFCPACGSGLRADAPPAGQERRLVTILFTDVTGS